MLVETDRDKFAVHQIIDFYHAQNIDYADYFQTAVALPASRGARGKPNATLGRPRAAISRQRQGIWRPSGRLWRAPRRSAR
jgi:hypothetical protein